MSEIKVRSKAPAFKAAAVGGYYDGQTVSLADLHGKMVVRYFYRKDDTPGRDLRRTRAAGVNQRFLFAADAGFFVIHRDAVERSAISDSISGSAANVTDCGCRANRC